MQRRNHDDGLGGGRGGEGQGGSRAGGGEGGGGATLHVCYKPRVRAVDVNVLMVACTPQHTVVKLLSVVNMVVF